MSAVTRGPTGHRCGADHHRARAPDAVVATARRMHDAGQGYKRIGRALAVPPRTVADWCRYDTRWAA